MYFKNDNVVNMSFIFYKCYSLEKLNFSQFNINKVNIKENFFKMKKNSMILNNLN